MSPGISASSPRLSSNPVIQSGGDAEVRGDSPACDTEYARGSYFVVLAIRCGNTFNAIAGWIFGSSPDGSKRITAAIKETQTQTNRRLMFVVCSCTNVCEGEQRTC